MFKKIFKRKSYSYSLHITIRRAENSFTVIRHAGYKKIDYEYDKMKGILQAILFSYNGDVTILEYKNVTEVEKLEIQCH